MHLAWIWKLGRRHVLINVPANEIKSQGRKAERKKEREKRERKREWRQRAGAIITLWSFFGGAGGDVPGLLPEVSQMTFP